MGASPSASVRVLKKLQPHISARALTKDSAPGSCQQAVLTSSFGSAGSTVNERHWLCLSTLLGALHIQATSHITPGVRLYKHHKVTP